MSQYIEMVDLEDDQEEMTSQDDYETESNHSMDIDDEEGVWRMRQSQHKSKLHPLSTWQSRQEFEHLLCVGTVLFLQKSMLALSSICERCICYYQSPPIVTMFLCV